MTVPTIAKNLDKEYRCNSRFCITTMRTRFGTYEHFVSDAETVSDHDIKLGHIPEIVFQTESYEKAHQYCDNFETSLNR